ncbi:unnamed protein product, partial [Brassica rapa subsp. narinosa]
KTLIFIHKTPLYARSTRVNPLSVKLANKITNLFRFS